MRARPRSRAAAAVLVLALGTGVAGCGDDGGGGAAGAEGEAEVLTFPPNSYEELASMFNPELEPLGLRLARGSLINRYESSNYEESPTGNHLAVYVEPIGEYTPEQYVAGIHDATVVFAPRVFERWTGLESFDVCQEPAPSVDAAPEPDPETLVEMNRAQVEAFDWEGADPSAILAAALDDPPMARVIISDEVEASPAYQQAFTEAQSRAQAG